MARRLDWTRTKWEGRYSSSEYYASDQVMEDENAGLEAIVKKLRQKKKSVNVRKKMPKKKQLR